MAPLTEIVRKVLLTYWNTAAFFVLYAATSTWSPHLAQPAPAATGPGPVGRRRAPRASRPTSTSAMESYDTARGRPALAEFVDDLSNWYVRRSRRRFWEGDPDALTTLYECLDTSPG